MGWTDLQAHYHWPAERPDIKATLDGWKIHETAWYELLSPLEQPIIAEVGAWMGKTSRWILERFSRARLIAIDVWSLDKGDPFCTSHYNRWLELGRVKPTDSLADMYRANLWDFRNRLVMIQDDSVHGMQRASAHVRPSVVYIDAAHDHDSVIADIETTLRLFPHALICGDDYKRGGPVATAVHEIADERGFGVQLYGNTRFWRYLR